MVTWAQMTPTYRQTHNNNQKKKIYNAHIVKHLAWIRGTCNRQVDGQSMLIVNELRYEVRLEVVLEIV